MRNKMKYWWYEIDATNGATIFKGEESRFVLTRCDDGDINDDDDDLLGKIVSGLNSQEKQ